MAVVDQPAWHEVGESVTWHMMTAPWPMTSSKRRHGVRQQVLPSTPARQLKDRCNTVIYNGLLTRHVGVQVDAIPI